MNTVLRAVLGWMTVVAVIFTISTYLVAMVLSVTLVWGTQLEADLSALSINGLPPLGGFFIYFRLANVPISINLLAYVSFCILVFATCFVAAFRSRGGFLQSLGRLPKMGRVTRSSNWLVVMPLLSSGLLVIVVLVTNVLSAAGVPSGTLCKVNVDCPSTAKLFAGLAHAPIGEELAYRILTPLALVLPIRMGWRRLMTGQGPSNATFLSIIGRSILSPDQAKMRTGYPSVALNGWRGIHWLEWIFVAGSAITFGLAHVQSGGADWGQGKVVTAAISGAVLAAVFLAYGAFATILLHWFFDFYVEVLMLGLPVSGDLTILFANLVIFGGLFLIGIFSSVIGAAWLGKKILRKLSPTTYKPPEVSFFPAQ